MGCPLLSCQLPLAEDPQSSFYSFWESLQVETGDLERYCCSLHNGNCFHPHLTLNFCFWCVCARVRVCMPMGEHACAGQKTTSGTFLLGAVYLVL